MDPHHRRKAQGTDLLSHLSRPASLQDSGERLVSLGQLTWDGKATLASTIVHVSEDELGVGCHAREVAHASL